MLSNEELSTELNDYPRAGADVPAVIGELVNEARIRINGNAPWDIQVKDPETYRRVLTDGSLGFGEAYMDGLWETESLDELMNRLLRADVEKKFSGWAKFRLLGEAIRQNLFNLQSRRRAYQVGEQHYDIGNDVFTAMLDPSMSYSCGYWEHADDLAQAQYDKNDLICRKLELKPGERLLDIGCGWGGLARYAAEHYGVEVTGITISREQADYAREHCAGLPVTIELTDYRDLNGSYDKLVSVGMFEHVGPKNYKTYFDAAARLMKDEGLFLLHTIGIHATSHTLDPWIDRYIFPNGRLPSAEQIASAMDGRLVLQDWHNFGLDYDRTLMAWWDNFDAAWHSLQDKYSERFYRMWRYYLMSCAGFFRSGQGQLWQLVLGKYGRRDEYRSIRG